MPDFWIRKMAQENKMIEPFVDKLIKKDVLSYGLSSYGYDARVSDNFKIFTNVNSATVDPKNFSNSGFVDRKEDFCIIPPNNQCCFLCIIELVEIYYFLSIFLRIINIIFINYGFE